MKNEIVLIMGYPACGKTSHAEGFVKKGYIRLNRDNEGGKVVDLVPKLKAQARGKCIVIDNLFASAESRAPFIAAAKELELPIRCVWVDTSIEDAQLNACLRMVRKFGHLPTADEIKKAKDPNTFPIAVMYMYRKQFERPTKAEGFEEVTRTGFTRQWGSDYKNKAIIFDYDGTLRRSRGSFEWPEKPDEVELLPNRMEVLGLIRQTSFILLGVSNQSACSKGLSIQSATDCFDKTNALLGLTKPDTIDYQFCPHRAAPPSCWCRKPAPGIAAAFIEKYKLDPSKCIVVGDMTSDKTFAQRAGFMFAYADEFFNREKNELIRM